MNKRKQAFQWIDQQQNSMLGQLQQWSNINTHTFNLPGLNLFTKILVKEFSVFKQRVQIIPSHPVYKVNAKAERLKVPLGKTVYLQMRPKAKRQVICAIHMDTVFSSEHPFQKCILKNKNILIGPGVTDAKGGIMVMLKSLQAFEQYGEKNNLGWQVIINPDEEIGSPGSTHVFYKAASRAQYGLIFEPCLPNGNIVSERKGSGNFTIVVHGQAAHAGRDFYRGKNAIVALAECITLLSRLTGEKKDLTVNAGRIYGGEAHNIVAPLAILKFNVRIKNPQDEKYVLGRIRKIMAHIKKIHGVKTELYGGFFSPPKPLDRKTAEYLDVLKSCYADMGLKVYWQSSGGVCDGNRLAARGVPTIDSLGVKGDFIHSPQEYLEIKSLAEKTKLTTLLLSKIAEGVLD